MRLAGNVDFTGREKYKGAKTGPLPFWLCADGRDFYLTKKSMICAFLSPEFPFCKIRLWLCLRFSVYVPENIGDTRHGPYFVISSFLGGPEFFI